MSENFEEIWNKHLKMSKNIKEHFRKIWKKSNL